MTSSLLLDSTFAAPPGGNGTVRMRLVNAGAVTFSGFRLALNSFVQLTPPAGAAVQLTRRIGTYHEIAPPAGFELEPGAAWDIGPLDCMYPLVHANDGPVGAFLVGSDGSTVPVRAVLTERAATVRVGDAAPPALLLDQPTDVTGAAWAAAAGREHRLYPDDAKVLSNGGDGGRVEARIDDSLGAEDFCVASVADASFRWTIAAGSPVALQWAFMELARRLRGDGGLVGSVFTPRHGYRGLMLDLARHFYPSGDVEEVIDIAAWRRLNRLHLHLTDDQAWRIPIAAYPALAEVGAWRGHGLPIPPQNGSGADAYGGYYTHDDIRRWITKASELGIELIPEIDVPGHCYAAIAAVPELRDPDDTGGVESVHNFRHNVLNPGLPGTRTFLEAVFGEVADLFPGPSIVIGGDEVPDGVWQSSPPAQRYAAERGLDGHRAIEGAFVADIVEIAMCVTGRRIGAAQEAAQCGGLRPRDGYVLGWKSNKDCKRLAASGYTVVAEPAEAFYLDMATGPEWHIPGTWWAGMVTSDVISGFDVTDGWDEAAKANLLGIQACLWGEHVSDRATLRSLLLPRLDAFGDAAWRALQ
jgi:hexosaminidase